MSKLTLWLIRHGESAMNAGVWTINPAESPLTSKGLIQASACALEIKHQPDVLLCSPMLRAQQTAQYIINRWPTLQCTNWPIQEFIYCSPIKLQDLSSVKRKKMIADYWSRCDIDYCDGEGAESFRTFFQRVYDFHQQVMRQTGFVVAVGHGQFFKAYQIGLEKGFNLNTDWMRLFRQQEISQPMKNGDLYKVL